MTAQHADSEGTDSIIKGHVATATSKLVREAIKGAEAVLAIVGAGTEGQICVVSNH
jgi:hypothetical protein